MADMRQVGPLVRQRRGGVTRASNYVLAAVAALFLVSAMVYWR